MTLNRAFASVERACMSKCDLYPLFPTTIQICGGVISAGPPSAIWCFAMVAAPGAVAPKIVRAGSFRCFRFYIQKGCARLAFAAICPSPLAFAATVIQEFNPVHHSLSIRIGGLAPWQLGQSGRIFAADRSIPSAILPVHLVLPCGKNVRNSKELRTPTFPRL